MRPMAIGPRRTRMTSPFTGRGMDRRGPPGWSPGDRALLARRFLSAGVPAPESFSRRAHGGRTESIGGKRPDVRVWPAQSGSVAKMPYNSMIPVAAYQYSST